MAVLSDVAAVDRADGGLTAADTSRRFCSHDDLELARDANLKSDMLQATPVTDGEDARAPI
jgi:hypothetical protein